METLKEHLSRFLELLTPIREELIVFMSTFLISMLIFYLVDKKLRDKHPDEIGMRFVEDLEGQILVRVRNPGNIRAITRMIPMAQNVMISFARMDSSEFDYAISLLKKFGEMRGVPIIKVEKGLYLVRGAPVSTTNLANGAIGAQIVDFQGNEVSPN